MSTSNRITGDSIVDLILHLKWKSATANHTDGYNASGVNIWRDLLPQQLLDEMMGKEAGERLEMPLSEADISATFNKRDLFDIKRSQFDPKLKPGVDSIPRLGRFYPKGVLKGVTNVFNVNVQPFRCVGINNGHMSVDLNHPLAGKQYALSAVVGKVDTKDSERGGTSVDWMERLATGPGMQARWQNQATDYFGPEAFNRDDERPDSEFYDKPRFVHHIDATAREMVTNTYGRFVRPGMRVLDLMSSWESHLDPGLDLERLVGLGLNKAELKRNPQLNDFVVQDLNTDGRLPFDPNTFDLVVNTVSVEYLNRPLDIFNEVARVLRPDGYFVVTFSNRWFAPKAIRIWPQLHEFERMGLVLEYFSRSGWFKDLQTYSVRGLPRPHDDEYFPQLMFSDPVFAVWGRKA